MALFVTLTGVTNSSRVEEAIKREFPGENYKIDAGQIIISADGMTTLQVAQKIGVRGASNQAGFDGIVIFAISNYWGHHNKDMWEWLAARSKDLAS
jgi:hypothetical protein